VNWLVGKQRTHDFGHHAIERRLVHEHRDRLGLQRLAVNHVNDCGYEHQVSFSPFLTGPIHSSNSVFASSSPINATCAGERFSAEQST